ncbi:MAG: hypothetical protein E7Z70_04305 [Thermoplasmata archaeon]|nr:hypothetical protein [Thermoplasmata archaeon]
MHRPATRDDWQFVDIGDQFIRIILKRRFSSEELGILRSGHRPEDMDDRWGSFMEGIHCTCTAVGPVTASIG